MPLKTASIRVMRVILPEDEMVATAWPLRGHGPDQLFLIRFYGLGRARPGSGMRTMKQKITLTINGKTYTDEVEPRLLLIHYLREVAGLTGPHIGCETSICGACTVMLDGKAVKSCTMFAEVMDQQKARFHLVCI